VFRDAKHITHYPQPQGQERIGKMMSVLLTGIGVFLCVGALLVVVLVLLVYRVLTSNRNNSGRVVDSSTTTPPGQASSQPVEEVYNAGSPGGFNSIPATGEIRRGAVVYTTPDDLDRPVRPVSLEHPGAEDENESPSDRPVEGL
jgi:hypothetical protein